MLVTPSSITEVCTRTQHAPSFTIMLTAVRLHLRNKNNVSSDGIFRVLLLYVIWAYFITEEYKKESIQMEDFSPEGARISNQDPEGETYTMVVFKWSDEVEGSKDDIYSPLCGGLYK